MLNFTQNTEKCSFCITNDEQQIKELNKCKNCREKGDLVGEIVLQLIKHASQQTRDRNRVIFMLAGLSSVYLEGIARKLPKEIGNKYLMLRINPDVANHDLNVANELLSRESSTHWRHFNEADIIVFAPPDSERNNIGTSLSPIPVIDENCIVSEINGWVKLLNQPESQSKYLEGALWGLKESGVYIDLDRWVDFILSIKNQGYSTTIDLRIKKAVPALHIPIFGITDLPKYNNDKPPPDRVKFRRAFEVAKNQVGVYAGLITPKNDRVVIEDVQIAKDHFETGNDPKLISSLDFVQKLIDDSNNIRPGSWRTSQKNFCENVNWGQVGSRIFTGNRNLRNVNIGEQTLNYLEGNFNDEITLEEKEYLNKIGEDGFTQNSKIESEFFEKWKERLYNAPKPHVSLFRKWQGRVFPANVFGQELLTLFLDGFEALIKKGYEQLEEMDDPCILVRCTHPNKADYWESKDREVVNLFKFELGSIINHLDKYVEFELSECFNIKPENSVFTKDGRSIELELYLVDRKELSDPEEKKRNLNNTTRVKATWQPGREAKREPITLSLVQDLEDLDKARGHNNYGLFLNKKFASIEGRISPISLHDRNTFDDVSRNRTGRVFKLSNQENEDLIRSIKLELKKYLNDQLVIESVVVEINSALEKFMSNYEKAITEIATEIWDGEGFGSPSIITQAIAFGELCKICRNKNLDNNLKRKLQSYVVNIGIVFSEENTAIITPWHPFRLAEKYLKIIALSEFIRDILANPHNSDISMEFGDLRKKLINWYFPEITYYRENTLISIESLGGYSLLVSASNNGRRQETLEISAEDAAEYFSKAIDRYLDIHPHEAANLSISIYNSESESLPSKISDLLAARFHKDKDLRCDLIISHYDQERLQEIFRNQNRILSTGEIGDNVKAILSRLRVDVRSHNHNSGSEIRDLDILFLHESISNHSQNSWELTSNNTNKIKTNFDLSDVEISRRLITEEGIDTSTFYQTCPQPPEAIAHYHDMLYELDKNVSIPNGSRAYYFSRIKDSDKVVQLLKESHNLADWVVTYDKSISRRVLKQCDVKIIQEITSPVSDGRVIISASKIEEELLDNLINKISNTCQINWDESQQIASYVMDDITRIAGQKLLSAIRNDNIVSEILGVCLLKSKLDASIPKKSNPTIWISLDDFRSWITSGKGKIADLLGITIEEKVDGFHIYMQIGEAKYISKYSLAPERSDAQEQVENTIEYFKKTFVDNDNPINRKAWCSRLEKLILNQEYQFSKIEGFQFRSHFLSSLRNGKVQFHVCGDSVICLHDDDIDQITSDSLKPYLRTHIISRYSIKTNLQKLFEGTLLKDNTLEKISWYSGDTIITENVDIDETYEDIENDINTSTEPTLVHEPTQVTKPDQQFHEPTNSISETDDNEKTEITHAHTKQKNTGFIPQPINDVLIELAQAGHEDFKDSKSFEWAENVCEDLQRALSEFGYNADFKDINNKFRLTPNGVLVTFKGNPTLTEKTAGSKRSELLTTHELDVTNILPGSGSITFFIKRKKRALVPLASSLLEFHSETNPEKFSNFLIGSLEDEDSNLPLNLEGGFAGFEEHAPHTLIAGETGSGKGVLVQNLILQMIAFNHPSKVDLYLIDPKMGVDYFWVEDAPHFKEKIITEVRDAENLLSKLVLMMDERYELFNESKSKNLVDYNRKTSPEKRLSRVVLIHDEMGSWMAEYEDYRKVVQSTTSNLGMKARAAGIHLILITQRADKDAIPPNLRDNLGNRFCLKVNSSAGSKLVLGCEGAERLLGKGHIACKLANQNPPSGQEFFVAQVPYTEQGQIDKLVQTAVKYWKGVVSNSG